ncbi:uncharacterized protein M6B38_310800 [Iris pallida]|uniref:Uncharacterized protein n=1 Tax=Iris pallida TaxID=29817 RepID=A0AAX6HH36_IRIPA|nr:uncharacterized protein M6B38_310800 [Iris pallida]
MFSFHPLSSSPFLAATCPHLTTPFPWEAPINSGPVLARTFMQALRPVFGRPASSLISDVLLEDQPIQPPKDINDIMVSFSTSEMQSIEAEFKYTLLLKFPK